MVRTVALSLVTLTSALAQVWDYSFQAASAGFKVLQTGPMLMTNPGPLEWRSIQLPFGFVFGSQVYPANTTIHVHAAGYIRFGRPDIELTGLNTPSIGNYGLGIIAPFWGNIRASQVRYQVTGAVGNRVLTIQWYRARWDRNAGSPSISFQLRLYEGSNIIEFHYQQESGSPNSGQARIGISYSSCLNIRFYSLQDVSNNPVVSTSIEGVINNDRPASGQIYRWIPNGGVLPNTPPGIVNVNLPFTGGPFVPEGNKAYYNHTSRCGDFGFGDTANSSPEIFFVLNPGVSGNVTIDLSAADGFFLSLHRGGIVSCQGFSLNGCIYGRAEWVGGNYQLCVYLEAGQTYYLVYESRHPLQSISISAPNPALPAAPYMEYYDVDLAGGLPYTFTGHLRDAPANRITEVNAPCVNPPLPEYYTYKELIWKFTAPATGSVYVSLRGSEQDFGPSSSLILVEGGTLTCSGVIGGTCVAHSPLGIWPYYPDNTLCATVQAGQTYYLIADRPITLLYPDYEIVQLRISGVNDPLPGVFDIDQLGGLPYNHGPDDVCDKASKIRSIPPPPTCGSNTLSAEGHDMIWKFTPNQSGFVDITLQDYATVSGLAGAPPVTSLHLYKGGTLTCGAIAGASCVSHVTSTSTFTGVIPETIHLCAYVEAGQTYWLVLENGYGLTGSICGSFANLSISGPTPVPGGIPGWVQVNALPYTHPRDFTCGKGDKVNSSNTPLCPGSDPDYYTGEDMIWTFTPNASGQVLINVRDDWPGGVHVYEGGNLSCNGISGTNCVAWEQGSPEVPEVKTFCVNVVANQTYHLVLDSRGGGCWRISGGLSISEPNANWPGVVNIGPLAGNSTYTYGPGTTCRRGNKVRISNNICDGRGGMGGEDFIWQFVPQQDGFIFAQVTGVRGDSRLFLYEGGTLDVCAGGLFGGTKCDTSELAPSNLLNSSVGLCAFVRAGETYYLVLDNGIICTNFTQLTIYGPNPIAPSGIVTSIGALPFTSGPGSTCGQGNKITPTTPPLCGSSDYYKGQDQVYTFTPTQSGRIQITLDGRIGEPRYTGLMLYEGGTATCGGIVGGVCRAHVQNDNEDKSICVEVVAGRTYYLVLDHWVDYPGSENQQRRSCFRYDNLTITDVITWGAHLCNAPVLNPGQVITASTSNLLVPTLSPCLGTCPGTYPVGVHQFVATSNDMTIRVSPLTLSDPGFAVYGGDCSAPVYIACDDNGGGCEQTPVAAQLRLNNLTPGETYYIVVSSRGGALSGDYVITLWNTATPPPPQSFQDCVDGAPPFNALVPCNRRMNFGLPGFRGSGTICDFPYPAPGSCPGNCISTGERNAMYFYLPINANGNLEFVITPTAPVDLDWALWRVDNVANPCAAIRSGALGPVRCSFGAPPSCDGSYATGIRCGAGCGGVLSCETQTSQEGFLECLPVSNGEAYILAISNYLLSPPSGFAIDFGNSPIDYTGWLGGPATWTGGSNNNPNWWGDIENWGGCIVPDNCAQDVLIFGGAQNQPVIPAGETYTVRNITIDAGASLVVNGTLRICGHLEVRGSLTGGANGRIEFVGDATYPVQEIRGVLTGNNYIPNLILRRSANGTVRLMTDVQVNRDVDITNSAVHTLDFNGYSLFVRRNFSNATVNNTVSATAPNSRLVLNGSGAQTYADPGSDPFREVVVNQTVTSTITLNHTLRVQGTLVLNRGILIAPTALTAEVRVENAATGAISGGNPNSFVAGYLRRYIAPGGGSYNFPVGLNNPRRYSLINFSFPGNPQVHNLLATFSAWAPPGPPTPAGNPVTECGLNYSCSLLDNGFWTVNAYNSDLTTQVLTSGSYTATLYNTDYTPCVGASQFGVFKNNGDPYLSVDWFIQNPGCFPDNDPQIVSRPDMSGFSHFATGQNGTPFPNIAVRLWGRTTAQGAHELFWQVQGLPQEGIRHYVLEAGAHPTMLTVLDTLPSSSHSYYRPYPPAGPTFYRLRLRTLDNDEALSSLVELLHVEGSGSGLQVSVFPNPASSEVTLAWQAVSSDPLVVSLYNSLGQMVMSRSVSDPSPLGQLSLDISGLSSGLYQLEVRQGGEVQTVRLQVER